MYLDLSRSTFRRERGYSGVVVQQGRVSLDADANEALDIALDRERRTLGDLVGACGVPRDSGAFRVSAAGGDLLVEPGRIYVDGVAVDATATAVRVTGEVPGGLALEHRGADGRDLAPCDWLLLTAGGPPRPVRILAVEGTTATLLQELTEAERDAVRAGRATVRRLASYTRQPFLSPGELVTHPEGDCPRLSVHDATLLVYLEVFERSVTALEDPALLEPALGGVDTTARRQIVWQLRLSSSFDGELAPRRPRGRLAARTVPPAEAPDDCTVPVAGGYRGLENQLYRVEIHRPADELRPPTFVWSREGGSVQARWIGVDERNRLLVDTAGPDREHGFAPGDWVEVTDRRRELRQQPGVVAQLVDVEGTALAIGLPANRVPRLADYPDAPRVRRWEGPPRDAVPDVFLPLEDGVEVRFAVTEDESLGCGDHWLVPARTVTADVEWPAEDGVALLRSPIGPTRSRCVLAEVDVAGGEVVAIRDRRPTLPPLTDLQAGDVGYSTGCEALSGVGTVEAALDRLCEQRDLPHHNRHLHGWGVVCGLRLACDPDDPPGDRRHVLVAPGYALDQDGHDLELDPAVRVDARALADGVPDALDADGSGQVSLVLRRGSSGPEVRAVPYRRPGGADLLDGTVVGDFVRECVQPLVADLRAVLRGLEDVQRRGRPSGLGGSAASLAAVFTTPGARGSIFVSRAEHDRLVALYERLRRRLRSPVYCGLLDDARPYPEYPAALRAVDDQVRTVPTRRHDRIVWRPRSTQFAATGGARGPVLHLYDAATGRLLVAEDVLTGSPESGSVRSPVAAVAFGRDGSEVHVAVVQGQDSLLRSGTIIGTTIRWGELHTVCGVRISALAVTGTRPEVLWAVGVGRGLFRFDPDDPGLRPEPALPFPAFGDLVTDAGFLSMTVRSEQGEFFDRVLVVTPELQGPRVVAETATGPGADGVAVVRSQDTPWLLAVLSGDQDDPKLLTTFGIPARGPVGERLPVPATTAHLAVPPADDPLCVLTTEDTHGVHVLEVSAEGRTRLRTSLPAPAGPSWTVAVPRSAGQQAGVAVLSRVAGVVTVYPVRLLRDPPDVSGDLTGYWRAATEAVADLTGAVAQYLKDCFCDRVLPDCPPDDGEDVVLGWVAFRDGRVDRVCNSSGRRYAGSFRTVGRWLSLLPVGPLLAAGFEALYCAALRWPYSAADRPAQRGLDALAGPVRGVVLRGLLDQLERLDLDEVVVELNRWLRDALAEVLQEFGIAQQPTHRISRRPLLRREVLRRVVPRRRRDVSQRIDQLQREMRDRDRTIDELRTQLADLSRGNETILRRLGEEPPG